MPPGTTNPREGGTVLCAHTIRRLKPGTFEEFVARFTPPEEAEATGWVRFYVLRGVADQDEVITFGFFDGTLKELESSQQEMGYEDLRAAIDPLVDSVVANGVYEIVQAREKV
jgi:hypothetical protein